MNTTDIQRVGGHGCGHPAGGGVLLHNNKIMSPTADSHIGKTAAYSYLSLKSVCSVFLLMGVGSLALIYNTFESTENAYKRSFYFVLLNALPRTICHFWTIASQIEMLLLY